MIKRVFKSEIKRILSDKRKLIIIAVIAVVFIALFTVTIVQWGNGFYNLKPVCEQARAQRLAEYQREIERCRAWCDYLSGATQTCPEELVSFQWPYEHWYHRLKEAEFFVDTQTIQEDYFYICYRDGAFAGYGFLTLPFGLNNYPAGGDKLICNSFEFLRDIFVPAIVISVLITFFQCECFKFGKQQKNYYAADVNDNGLFAGRYLVNVCIVALIWVVIAVWGVCFSFGCRVNQVLYYKNGEMHAESVYLLYFSIALSMLVAMLAASALTAFLSAFASKIWQYGLLTAAAFLVLTVVYVLLKYLLPEENYCGGIAFLPIIGLNANPCYFYFGWEYWLMIILNLVVSAALVISKIFILKRSSTNDKKCQKSKT